MAFPTPELLQEAVDSYFDSLGEGQPPTISGLAYHLDIDTRSVINYENRDGFFPIIKRAKQRVEQVLEQRLYEQGPTGAIFNLKCNFNWNDTPEQATEEKQTTAINFVVSERVEHD